MGPLKIRSARLVLLLALMLQLQSFAWIGCGSAEASPVAGHPHCPDPAGGQQTGDLAQQHHCGSCCVTAIGATPLGFTPPSVTHPGISLPAHLALFEVALDRLDRPPRLVIR
jgi:hypothetical protein